MLALESLHTAVIWVLAESWHSGSCSLCQNSTRLFRQTPTLTEAPHPGVHSRIVQGIQGLQTSRVQEIGYEGREGEEAEKGWQQLSEALHSIPWPRPVSIWCVNAACLKDVSILTQALPIPDFWNVWEAHTRTARLSPCTWCSSSLHTALAWEQSIDAVRTGEKIFLVSLV